MQVSTQNSLTWLQTTSAAAAATDQISSAYGQISPGDDASGAESGQSALAAQQSPAQMFAPASLDTLVSSQSATDATGATPTSPQQPATLYIQRHHHHPGMQPLTSTQDSDASTTTSGLSSATGAATNLSAATDGADTSAETNLSQLVANL
jgi:hypothetical protein